MLLSKMLVEKHVFIRIIGINALRLIILTNTAEINF